MNIRGFQHDFARAILKNSRELEYDDAVLLVRLLVPEIQQVISLREEMKLAQELEKKKIELEKKKKLEEELERKRNRVT